MSGLDRATTPVFHHNPHSGSYPFYVQQKRTEKYSVKRDEIIHATKEGM